MKIYKYPIPLESEFSLSLPMSAKILSFQVQDGKLFIWAIVNTNVGEEKREFELIGTGVSTNFDYRHFIGTVQLDRCVWHLFEFDPDRYERDGSKSF